MRELGAQNLMPIRLWFNTQHMVCLSIFWKTIYSSVLKQRYFIWVSECFPSHSPSFSSYTKKEKKMPFMWRVANIRWHTDLRTWNAVTSVHCLEKGNTKILRWNSLWNMEIYLFIWHFTILNSSILTSYLSNKIFF